MVHISHHAILRFIQRYEKRRVHYKALSMADFEKARWMLHRMFTNATPSTGDRYVYHDYVLICKENTIITVYAK